MGIFHSPDSMGLQPARLTAGIAMIIIEHTGAASLILVKTPSPRRII
jgi:hypothetical protein